MFVSYAPNLEDVMLNRLFKDQDAGFYIDFLAEHPVEGSVTKAFYERGWSGINIREAESDESLWAQDRPRDINLASPSGGDRREPPCLSELCRDHVRGEIDFLRIDACEALEPLLGTHDWDAARPRVIILRVGDGAAEPAKRDDADSFLSARGYEAVYFDGESRFYLDAKSSGLKARFSAPPNRSDDFRCYSLAKREARIHSLKGDLADARAEVDRLNGVVAGLRETDKETDALIVRLRDGIAERDAHIAERDARIAELATMVEEIRRSWSWRSTFPLRFFARLVRRN